MDLKKALLLLAVAIVLVMAFTFKGGQNGVPSSTKTTASSTTQSIHETTTLTEPPPPEAKARTFNESSEQICTKNGKPIIRLYSTPWCPHCNWIKDTFDKVAKEYASAGKIVAYHWDIEKYDDLLTPAYEGTIPESEIDLLEKYNPEGYVPAFVFGCKYYRVGNGYESSGDLAAEEAEFQDIIDELVNSTEG